jgi:hypothetical protein
VIKARKEKKLQDKAKEKEDKRKTKEQQKKSVDNTKKAKTAATTAKARERKKRRATPPIEVKRAREGGTQGDQDPWGQNRPRPAQRATAEQRQKGQKKASPTNRRQPRAKKTTM